MSIATTTLAVLPYAMPPCPNARIALFAMRRMGAHGLTDAAATHVLLNAFAGAFRRPLTLLRALMADLAASSSVPIAIAPCCCARMTPGEHALLTVLALVETRPDAAALLLGDLIGQRRVDGVLVSAAAVAMAFADEGRPVCV